MPFILIIGAVLAVVGLIIERKERVQKRLAQTWQNGPLTKVRQLRIRVRDRATGLIHEEVFDTAIFPPLSGNMLARFYVEAPVIADGSHETIGLRMLDQNGDLLPQARYRWRVEPQENGLDAFFQIWQEP